MLVASEVISVPKRDDLMLPLLSFARERHVGKYSEVFNVRWTFDFLIDELELAEEVMEVKIKSGRSKFDNNVRWAINDLYNAKLLKRMNRGFYKITDRGLDVLEENPKKVGREYLMRFREFREYMKRECKNDFVHDDQSTLMYFI